MVITILIIKSYLGLDFLRIQNFLFLWNQNMFPECIFIFHLNNSTLDRIVPTSLIVLRHFYLIFLWELDSNRIAFFINRSPIKIYKRFIRFIMSLVLNQRLRSKLSLKHDDLFNRTILMEYLVQNFNADWILNISDCYKQHSSMLIVNIHVICNGVSTCEREEYFVWADSIFILRC